ncbi:cyclodeaminase/cyclohydrolase family protein [Simiduia curdlanivorans]|uniref:Cyclodeaminase/cyclohydrolase family protein n=1 Tax=Simiduia curdlanivorans TaxID=1492769 RepID=A0ABV8V4D4_9GAMM|nr:cyclodeaminase/cyclohydrolase family protein [Simiduia curdlanivorans]MDN3637361.1 cyclodeaminase/cyclohydrolase family protein [Simiduia curdlanivorans]
MTGKFLEKPTNKLLDDFGAGNASPGSGSAAALMGLLASKLTITVCKKSIEYAKEESEIKAFQYILDQVETHIEPKLKELFEKDATDFERVVELWRERTIESSTTKKAAISREANRLLENATDYVFEIIELCMTLIDHGVVVFESGWKTVRGDSGAAISASMAGVTSGIFIANLNLKTLKGRNYAASNIKKCDELYQRLNVKQTKAFSCVVSLNSEALEAIQLELPET